MTVGILIAQRSANIGRTSLCICITFFFQYWCPSSTGISHVSSHCYSFRYRYVGHSTQYLWVDRVLVVNDNSRVIHTYLALYVIHVLCDHTRSDCIEFHDALTWKTISFTTWGRNHLSLILQGFQRWIDRSAAQAGIWRYQLLTIQVNFHFKYTTLSYKNDICSFTTNNE